MGLACVVATSFVMASFAPRSDSLLGALLGAAARTTMAARWHPAVREPRSARGAGEALNIWSSSGGGRCWSLH
jgi:hypothetical protein